MPTNCPSEVYPPSWELWKKTVLRPMDDQLYHYTSSDALISILQHHQMWATHLQYAEDPTELIYATGILRDSIERAKQKYCAGLGAESTLAQWISSFEATMHAHLQRNDYYSISFCEKGDLLTQWRSYGAAGGGFAMGWRADSRLIGKASATAAIEYSRDRQDCIIDETLNMHVEQFITNGIPADVSHLSEYHRFLSGSLGLLLTRYLYAFKDFAFSNEHEFRLIYEFRDDDYHNVSGPFMRRFGQVIKPYIEIDLGSAELFEVVYGPTLERMTTEKWLRMMLKQWKYPDAHPRPSQIPMR